MGSALRDFPVQSVPFSSADVAVSTANADVTITYAANASASHVIEGFFVSYTGGTPAGAELIVTSGGQTVFDQMLPDLQVSGGGWKLVTFAAPLYFPINTAVVCTLKAGGASIVGKINALHWLDPSNAEIKQQALVGPVNLYTPATGDYQTATAATDSVVVAAPAANQSNVLREIFASYTGGTPAGGNVQILDGATKVFDLDFGASVNVVGGGRAQLTFPCPRRASAGNSMTVSLASGGAGIVAKLVVSNWTEGG